MKLTQTTTVTESQELVLDDIALRWLLNHAGYHSSEDAQIKVRVPGGGDYSNTPLSIDGYCIISSPKVKIIRDPHSNPPHVLFHASHKVDGTIPNDEAIKILEWSNDVR